MSLRLPAAAALLMLGAIAASAQVIAIKTLPIAQGSQFDIIPSTNVSMGNLSIAVRDSLRDPFDNPAMAARLRGVRVDGSPGKYSIGSQQGGGRGIGAAAFGERGALFGALLLVTQHVDSIPGTAQGFFNVPGTVLAGIFKPFPSATNRRTNNYVVGSGGARLGDGWSLGASASYAALEAVDGTELLYIGHQNLEQRGHDASARLGLLKDWSGGRSLEAVLVHERYAMKHDVTFIDSYWDPNGGFFSQRPRVEHNGDRTNTSGLRVSYVQPVRDSSWRLGFSATGNVASHPELPTYHIEEVRVIPWDPGTSHAYQLGAGLSRVLPTTIVGIEAVWEPIVTHTWGDAQSALQTDAGATIAAGGHTVDNHFTFSNGIVRAGASQLLDERGDLRFDLGIEGHTIHYWMHQDDHVAVATLDQEERWTEWSRTWGLSFRLGRSRLRYQGMLTTGAGRPSTRPTVNPVAFETTAAGSILTAPSGALKLDPVSQWTHRLSLTFAVR